jgi:DNA-binding beta-propeller fold protein YncE
VFNGATCDASDDHGCGQTPGSVKTSDVDSGKSQAYVAVDEKTNTVYATNVNLGNPFVGNRVYVIDGHTCDATHRTGCRRRPATVTAGFNPWGITMDQDTSVSVINRAPHFSSKRSSSDWAASASTAV